MDKEALISGSPLDTSNSYVSNPDPTMFSLYAVPSTYSDDDILYMVTVDNCKTGGINAVEPNGGCNSIRVDCRLNKLVLQLIHTFKAFAYLLLNCLLQQISQT